MVTKTVSLCDKGHHTWAPVPRRGSGQLHIERCSACGAVATWLPATELWEGAG